MSGVMPISTTDRRNNAIDIFRGVPEGSHALLIADASKWRRFASGLYIFCCTTAAIDSIENEGV